jgi:hypothetical protein
MKWSVGVAAGGGFNRQGAKDAKIQTRGSKSPDNYQSSASGCLRAEHFNH